jgi:hypothetical protein
VLCVCVCACFFLVFLFFLKRSLGERCVQEHQPYLLLAGVV